jgi:hypothetical protein
MYNAAVKPGGRERRKGRTFPWGLAFVCFVSFVVKATRCFLTTKGTKHTKIDPSDPVFALSLDRAA